jgi:hypothetical protein
MGREQDIEKKFTAYLDRILAGEEIKADPAMDAELRAALNFARKVNSLGAVPDAQFQARLKAALLEKLQAREARQKENRGSFWDIFRSHPAWQGAVAVLLVIIVISIIWRAGFFQPSISSTEKTVTPTTTAAPATAIPAPAYSDKGNNTAGTLISIDARTDKAAYQTGETVQIEITLKNISGGQLTVNDFPPILSVMQAETKQPVYTFKAGKETRVLAPYQVARYTYTWHETDFTGQPVTGSYYIELEDLEYNNQPLKLNLNNPVKFDILR